MKLTLSKFQVELNEMEKFLRRIKFLEERNFYPREDFDPSVYRSKNYIDNWKSLIAENIYTFYLHDNSILHFKVRDSGKKVNFTFYECPYHCITYNEYLIENDLEEEYEEKIFIDYYEVYLHQCKLKENPVMIRYDLDTDSYYEGLHPVSHIHIGNKNQIRLGIQKVLSPKSFLHFILRQHYSPQWKSLIANKDGWHKAYLDEKSTLANVTIKFWNKLDTTEFHLS